VRAGLNGSFRLFQFAGIDVYLHWLWFLVAVYQIQGRGGGEGALAWRVAEYLALFGIVLLHEFGHALATRQVGGDANTILLWPFGGVAYVSPPFRPGAQLWGLAAGPLVNVVLAIPLTALVMGSDVGLLQSSPSEWAVFIRNVWWINTGLFLFNMLPVYPLDGGQILRSLLWFVVGPVRSLYAATFVGFLGVLCLLALAILDRSVWLGIMTLFIGSNCWQGWRQARMLSALER
jgi:Zn-dependent protease